MYRFAAASENETIVYGSARPHYSEPKVLEWIEFMQNQSINRVCCLLDRNQLNNYPNLLDLYKIKFGIEQVCWTPIEDFSLINSQILIQDILPFLAQANQQNEKVVVHCSAGIGRTGQVLTAWLVYQREFTNQQAISTVMRMQRNPYEFIVTAAMKGENPQIAISQFNRVLDDCRRAKSNIE